MLFHKFDTFVTTGGRIPLKEDIMINIFLRKKREELGYSRERLARKSGVSASFIAQIESGKRNASVEVLLQIGKALNIDKIEILEQTGVLLVDELETHLHPMVQNKLDEQLKLLARTEESKVPIFNSVSAGIGAVPDAEPQGYLSLDIPNCADCVGIHVWGDSMKPTISDSAVILIRRDEDIHNGDVGVFLLNDEAYVKRYTHKGNIILLYSDNPSYEPIIVTEEDDFKICGKVIRTLNNL